MASGIQVNLHQGKVVSLCDADLLGKTFEEGERQLVVSEKFYKGEEKDEEEMACILKEAKNVNIVGKKAVGLALKAKVVAKEGILEIQGVPMAQVFCLE